jgi:hypothetical protein
MQWVTEDKKVQITQLGFIGQRNKYEINNSKSKESFGVQFYRI